MVKNLIFDRFWTLSAKVVTRGATQVPRHEHPTFLISLKRLISYSQGTWGKNAIFEMCQGLRWTIYAPMAWIKWVEKKYGCHWQF